MSDCQGLPQWVVGSESIFAVLLRPPRCDILGSVLRRLSMVDHEKLQKGRGWAYLAGIVIFVAVVVWKFVGR
jgi:hypothetical protein